jgi:hypothetical protein
MATDGVGRVPRWAVRLSGVLVATTGALTLGLGAALWFLLFLWVPIAAAEVLVGLRLFASKSRWYGWIWVIALTNVVIGVTFLNGFMAPVAFAYLTINVCLIAVWLVGLALRER